MKTKTITLLILLGLLLAGLIDVQETYDPHELIRFHVLANSDSDADQALKLAVKDQVVTYMQTLLDGAEDVQDSRQIIQSHLPDIKQQAQLVLDRKRQRRGRDGGVWTFRFSREILRSVQLAGGQLRSAAGGHR